MIKRKKYYRPNIHYNKPFVTKGFVRIISVPNPKSLHCTLEKNLHKKSFLYNETHITMKKEDDFYT